MGNSELQPVGKSAGGQAWLLLALDELLAIVRECINPKVSRSGLDRCLRRHGRAL
ncbi:hypothetical protein CT0489 [Chlorobaculum tepidum TLS]|uniref:Transposase n=1 Tax=Chlorobaculum tepidum (strain ATCC 49652 / DSM 12025 / NBRC 103806 / TLS) TaxID=194439 RepID=Q8KF43_CHLTE|nr:hypothetical protein CT0489 [Chlorobaculum tepidum TLS]